MKATAVTPLRLYLIRHGETAWSLSGRHTGRTDLPLTPNGEDEARGLGKHLRGIRFAHVLTSPLKRALQTCELVGLNQNAEIESDLAEWDYGYYEGLRSVDIYKERPGWNVYRDGCPRGEMPAQISARADRLIARLRTLDGNVALFAHGQIGSVLAARWIGLAVAEAQHFMLGTASLSIFAFDPHHPAVPVIALWNAGSQEVFNTVNSHPVGGTMTMRQRAIERWENKGGDIPQPTLSREKSIAPLTTLAAWQALVAHYPKVRELHLRELFADDATRGERMTVEAVGIYFDYSKHPHHRRDTQAAVAIGGGVRLAVSHRGHVPGRKDQRHGEAGSFARGAARPQGAIHLCGRRRRRASCPRRARQDGQLF